MKIGYARVSTQDQNLDLQMNALNSQGCEQIFSEIRLPFTRSRSSRLLAAQTITARIFLGASLIFKNMKTPITPEALIEMGFEKVDRKFVLQNPYILIYESDMMEVFGDFNLANATTIEDIKDLIRLFK